MTVAEEEKPFILLAGVNTKAATPASVSMENIRANMGRGLPNLSNMPEFQKIKGKDIPIALVGGGPSLKDTIHELKDFKHVIACGSVHDYLVKNGVISEYCMTCDPDPIMANYLKTPHSETKYLISSNSDSAVFDALKGMPVAMWHCGPLDIEEMNKIDPNWQIVGGGCTVGLRSISMAILLGYENLHFFGFDSCLGEDEKHHAYDFTDESEELGEIFKIKIGSTSNGPDEDSKIYRCAGYHMAQADHFKIFTTMYGNIFTPTFHGTGLLPALWEMIETRAKEMTAQQQEAGPK
jgi:hypothetical protein